MFYFNALGFSEMIILIFSNIIYKSHFFKVYYWRYIYIYFFLLLCHNFTHSLTLCVPLYIVLLPAHLNKQPTLQIFTYHLWQGKSTQGETLGVSQNFYILCVFSGLLIQVTKYGTDWFLFLSEAHRLVLFLVSVCYATGQDAGGMLYVHLTFPVEKSSSSGPFPYAAKPGEVRQDTCSFSFLHNCLHQTMSVPPAPQVRRNKRSPLAAHPEAGPLNTLPPSWGRSLRFRLPSMSHSHAPSRKRPTTFLLLTCPQASDRWLFHEHSMWGKTETSPSGSTLKGQCLPCPIPSLSLRREVAGWSQPPSIPQVSTHWSHCLYVLTRPHPEPLSWPWLSRVPSWVTLPAYTVQYNLTGPWGATDNPTMW